MYLIWLFYEKYDKLLNEEERDKRDLAEHTMFKYNFGLKCLGLTGLLYSLFRLRKPNRSYIVDFLCLYGSAYTFILSYVLPVYYTWPLYEDLTKKMLKSG